MAGTGLWTRRTLATLATLAVVTAACGDGGGLVAADDEAAFCALVTQMEAEVPAGEASAADYRRLASAAPTAIRGDLEAMAQAFEELDAYEQDDPEGFAAAMELLGDPDFQSTAGRVERYLVDVCGVDLDGLDPDESMADADGEDPGAALEDADWDDWDDTDFDDVRILGVAGREVDARVDELFGHRAVGQGRHGSNGHTDLRIDVLELTVAEALAACTELASFLAGHPDAQGTATLRLAFFDWDDPDGWDDPANDRAVNDLVAPGDPGTCGEAP